MEVLSMLQVTPHESTEFLGALYLFLLVYFYLHLGSFDVALNMKFQQNSGLIYPDYDSTVRYFYRIAVTESV